MRLRTSRWVGASLLTALALVASPGPAAQAGAAPTAADRQAAERERAALRDRIEAINREIARSEQSRVEAADALQASERAISEANRKLARIGTDRKRAEDELRTLEGRIARAERDLSHRRDELSAQLRQQYATGGTSPWSALLSGDDPQRTGRTLGYLSYVSRARAEAVEGLRKEIAHLNDLQQQAQAHRDELTKLATEQETEQQELLAGQQERKRVLTRIAGELREQRGQADRLVNDDKRLSSLITQIGREMAREAERVRLAEIARKEAEAVREAQARKEAEARRVAAEKAAAQARDAERQARQNREREAQAQRDADATRAAAAQSIGRGTTPQGGQLNPALADSPAVESPPVAAGTPESRIRVTPTTPPPAAPTVRDAPAVVIRTPVPPAVSAPPSTPEPAATTRGVSTPGASAPGSFAAQKGKLRLPLRSETIAQVPGRRGIFIAAADGAQVRATAGGTVVFANWLRGFGNMVIVDHGDDYLSIYGNNQTLLKQVGEPVRSGEVIANAGSTGGQPQSGLYFELRYRGEPIDPRQWVSPH